MQRYIYGKVNSCICQHDYVFKWVQTSLTNPLEKTDSSVLEENIKIYQHGFLNCSRIILHFRKNKAKIEI